MSRLLSPGIQESFIRWATRDQATASRTVYLDRRRIFILPTRNGVIFGIVLIFMLMGAIHYSNSLAFMLTFLLAGLFGITMWQTHRNLLDLEIEKGSPRPAFAGSIGRLPLEVENRSRWPRVALALQWQDAEIDILSVDARSVATAMVAIRARRRGWLRPGRLRLYTRFPLGLFQAWTWMEFDWDLLVYPKPIETTLPADSAGLGDERSTENIEGNDDFMGLRDYRPGDSSRHIAWKALARIEQPLTKQFSSGSREELWLDWDHFTQTDTELRLSMLCHQVILADHASLSFGLRLPGVEIAPDQGQVHKDRCLKALALYEG